MFKFIEDIIDQKIQKAIDNKLNDKQSSGRPNNTSVVDVEQLQILTAQVKKMQAKIDELESSLEKIRSALNKVVGTKLDSKSPTLYKDHSAEHSSQPSPQVNGTKSQNPTSKILYSGFENNMFPIRLKVGMGEDGLSNSRANWIVEYVKGANSGNYYPNVHNLSSLAFNVDYNLAPVCYIERSGNMRVLQPGTVRYDTATNAFVIESKCKITI